MPLFRGLNANLVHKWRRRQHAQAIDACAGQDNVADAFVALPLPPPPTATAVPDIRLEVRRGAASVGIAWPAQAANECATWLRERLR